MSTQGNVYDVLMERGFIEQATHPDEIRELLGNESVTSVSYTHLDVYKRQNSCFTL